MLQLCANILLIVAICLTASSASAQWGTLKGRFVWKQKPPPAPILAAKAGVCGQFKIGAPAHKVGPNGGAGDLLVWMYLSKDDPTPKIKPGAEVELGQVIHTFRCQFVSNVTLVRTGQRFAIRNEDNFPHAVSITFLNNREQSTSALPPGPEQFIKLKKRERIPIPMTCGFHPWMKSYLVVTDHPYAVLTKPDGTFEMELPAGDHEIQVRHMVGKGGYIDQVIQQGEAVKWPKGKIRHVEVNGVNKVRITAGETVDLGVILIQ